MAMALEAMKAKAFAWDFMIKSPLRSQGVEWIARSGHNETTPKTQRKGAAGAV